MPRNAGCNMSEIISVQLANYIKNYLLNDVNVPRKDFFGHHNSKLTEDFLQVSQQEILDVLAKYMNIHSLNHQSENSDGLKILYQPKDYFF